MTELQLIPLTSEYLEFWHWLYNDPETRRHQPIRPTTLTEQAEMLERFRDHDLGNDTLPAYKWVLLEPKHNRPAGIVSFTRLQIDQGIGRIGYSIIPQYWRKGLATAAVRCLVDIVFSHTNTERLEAVCSVNNPASQRVLEKAGFKYEGIRRGYLRIREKRVDHYSFALLKSDWQAN